jgi:hypothetical protein
MPKQTDQSSGVVGGTMDLSRDTTVDERDGSVLDAMVARRHEAERRAKLAERMRKGPKGR